jgi:hypothetical protein
MRTRVENDLIVFREPLFHHHRKAIEMSERRHRSNLAVREEHFEVFFVRMWLPYAFVRFILPVPVTRNRL